MSTLGEIIAMSFKQTAVAQKHLWHFLLFLFYILLKCFLLFLFLAFILISSTSYTNSKRGNVCKCLDVTCQNNKANRCIFGIKCKMWQPHFVVLHKDTTFRCSVFYLSISCLLIRVHHLLIKMNTFYPKANLVNMCEIKAEVKSCFYAY